MRRLISSCFILCFCLVLFLSVIGCSLGSDILTSSQSMKDGETLVSADGSFVLGFFSRGNSRRNYLGIWYSFTPDVVVWVANRKNPVNDSNGFLTFSGDGNLVVLDRSRNVLWSSNSSRNLRDPVARLLDTGNLVLGENGDLDSSDYSWQSFDYPSDTHLAGMKLGWDLRTGFERHLTSWKSADDPSPGDYTYGFKLEGLMQGRIMMGSVVKFRTGPWNGIQFTGISSAPSIISKPIVVYNETDAYSEFDLLMEAITTKVTLNPSGLYQRLLRNKGSNSWDVMHTIPSDFCDEYGQCGANSFCTLDKDPRCQCLPGFVPKSTVEWLLLNHTRGCVREIPLNCSNEGFQKVSPVNLPDLINFWLDKNMSLDECRIMCWNNCSCTAYANSDVRNGGRGCLMWFGDLLDIKEYHGNQYNQDMYIRLSALSLDHNSTQRRPVIASVTSAIAGMLILGLIAWTIKRKCQSKSKGLKIWEDDIDLPLFNFATVAAATDNFSEGNLIGAGGFGSVYKGNLFTDKEVAIKRLSKNSGQGLEEFMNEVVLIAKLQHKNLVGLLGCCIEREESMLIYEYMPNKSLDYFIFDHDRSCSLSWEKCCGIVSGIARGLLYLHHDSKLQVIHRDLKASNILLDGDMKPKISDFGLARIFSGNDNAVRTRRIIGTYGYMSPEYAFDGKFSVKSDVFSFGVLLLEIVSGEKNRGFCHLDHDHNLLGHAWLLWSEGKSLELMHESLLDPYIPPQVERFIHVALLCVQKFPDDRPFMSSVVFMLENEGTTLPRPKQPGFFLESSPRESLDVMITGERHKREGVVALESRKGTGTRAQGCRDSIPGYQMKRCVHVGLCVQKYLENRPLMTPVVFMLVNEGTALPEPKQPGFFTERSLETTLDRISIGELSPQAKGILTTTMMPQSH